MIEWSPESALAALRLASTRREFERLPSSELPELAVGALEAGFDSPALRQLAGELDPTWADSGPLFDRILLDLGITPLPRPEAADALARHYASQIVSGAVTPYEGASRIWWDVANECSDDPERWEQYSVFVGLGSEWEDHPPRRVDYERDIRDEAAKLLDRKA